VHRNNAVNIPRRSTTGKAALVIMSPPLIWVADAQVTKFSTILQAHVKPNGWGLPPFQNRGSSSETVF
jgi:hypothetical protein